MNKPRLRVLSMHGPCPHMCPHLFHPPQVPLSRLVAMNKPEWLYIIVGSIAAAAVGCVQPSFALIISVMITTLYDTPKDKIMGEASFLSQMFFTIGVGVLIMSSIMFLCFGIIGGRLAYRLRQAMFKAELTKRRLDLFSRHAAPFPAPTP
eukprot:354214-Chlamydomonas_euryale.AAC.1